MSVMKHVIPAIRETYEVPCSRYAFCCIKSPSVECFLNDLKIQKSASQMSSNMSTKQHHATSGYVPPQHRGFPFYPSPSSSSFPLLFLFSISSTPLSLVSLHTPIPLLLHLLREKHFVLLFQTPPPTLSTPGSLTPLLSLSFLLIFEAAN